jgi:uncharacterized protein YxeA
MKTPKLPKIPKLQIRKRTEKIERRKFKVKKPGKRTLLILLVVLLVLAGLAGVGILKGVFNGFLKGEAEGKKTDTVQETQNDGKKADIADLQSLKENLGYGFIKTLRSDQYLIKYRTTTEYEGKAYEVETTYAVSGGSISLVAGDRATIVRDGKVYMLNHTDKSILSWDAASADHPKKIDTIGIEFVGSREEGGLVCEEYKTASSGIKLYFDGKNLVRMETIINKIDTIMNILEVSKKVPDSLFVVPEDYRTTEID